MAEEQKGGALSAYVQSGALRTKEERIAKAREIRAAANAVSTAGGDSVFLTYSGKRSRWSLGREKASPDPEALYVIDPDTTVQGWTCWKGGQAVGKHEWNLYDAGQQAVPASRLEDHGPYANDGDGWRPMMGFMLFDTDDPTTPIKFTSNSKSGLNVVSALVDEMFARLEDGEPETPIVKLADEQFTAQGQTNGKPKFVVEGWVSREEVEAFIADENGDVDALLDGAYAAESEPEPEPEPAPRAARRAAPKAAPAPAKEPEPAPAAAPRARRQRRSAA